MNRIPTTAAALVDATIENIESRSLVLPDVALLVGLLEALAVVDGAVVTVAARLDVWLGAKELVIELVDLDVDVVELGIDMTLKPQSAQVTLISHHEQA
jgi:hypothetical protein